MLPEIPYLIVADESPIDRGLTCRLLQTLLPDSPILEANHGEQVLRWLRLGIATDNLPKLVLLDLDVPFFNGYEVLAEIQKQAWHQVPVVTFSGSSLPEEESRVLGLGARALYQKPLLLADNLSMLKEILSTYGAISFPAND